MEEIRIQPLVIGLVASITTVLQLTNSGPRVKALVALGLALVITVILGIADPASVVSFADPSWWARLALAGVANGLAAMGMWSGTKAVAGK